VDEARDAAAPLPPGMSTGRIEAFSDGVFAVAITLLALDLPRPEPGEASLAHELAHGWPQYLAFVVSFFTVGIIWVNHHAQFSLFHHGDRTLLFLNLTLLGFVTVLPVTTSIAASYLRGGGDQAQLAVAVYALSLEAMSLAFYLLWRHAGRAGLMLSSISPQMLSRRTRRNMVGHVVYLLAAVLAFLSPFAALALCGAVALYYIHPGARDAAVA
jgi:uncharacterized membrane protein